MSKNAVINLLNLPLYCQVTLSEGGLILWTEDNYR